MRTMHLIKEVEIQKEIIKPQENKSPRLLVLNLNK
jgi:hypothetical protein